MENSVKYWSVNKSASATSENSNGSQLPSCQLPTGPPVTKSGRQ